MVELNINTPLDKVNESILGMNDKLSGLQKNIIDDNLDKLQFGDKLGELLGKVNKTLNVNLFGLGTAGSLLGVKLFDINKYKNKGGFWNVIFKKYGGIEGLHKKYVEETLATYFTDQPEKSAAISAMYAGYEAGKSTNVVPDASDPDGLLNFVTSLGLDEKEMTELTPKIPQMTFGNLSKTILDGVAGKEQYLDPNVLASFGYNPPRTKGPSGNEIIDITNPAWDLRKVDQQMIQTYLHGKVTELSTDAGFTKYIQSPDHFVLSMMGGLFVTGNTFPEAILLGIKKPEDFSSAVSPQKTTPEINNDTGEVTKETTDYATIVNVVIDRLEGGYYHPNMLANGTIKDQRYSSSGETMFGIDRKNGGTLNTSDAGKEFWGLIDAAKASATWERGYRGGDLEQKLRGLAGDIIKPHYEGLCKKYLSEESLKLINTDGRVLFNFIYGAWNGAGWFKKMADVVNAKVAAGVTDTNELLQAVIDFRKNDSNSLLTQGGKKIEHIVGLA